LTAGGLFGAHAVVPSTGIVAAQIPEPATLWSLAPMLVVNDFTKDTFLAAAAAGDAAAPVALNEVVLPIVESHAKPADAVSAPRLTYNAAIDATTVESAGDDMAHSLTVRGHRVGRVPALARVNILYCEGGARRDGQSCRIATDPRGFGLALGADH
jgi:gamma-glutamyltranspeptidase/glutathione hydrolase